MPGFWDHCQFYIVGKVSLLLMTLLDMVPDLGHGRPLVIDNNGFGPICKPRGSIRILIANLCAILFILFCFLMPCRWTQSKSLLSLGDLHLVCNIVFSIMTADILERLCMFAEEIWHVKERYDGDKWKALRVCMYSKDAIWTILIVYISVAGITIKGHLNEKYIFCTIMYIITATFVKLCCELIRIKPLSRVEISELYESGKKNVAAGLAWSFYFGYLKIILPDFNKIFLKARGENYKYENEDICDLIHERNRRLYIIIPKDGYCKKKFEELDDRITLVRAMPEQVKSRGGVSQRSYKNMLYRIEQGENLPRYVVMEYSSNLSSMYDMSNSEKAGFCEEERKKQISIYYRNIWDIVAKDPECAGRARLILIGPTSNGSTFGGRKLGDIICEQLDKDLND